MLNILNLEQAKEWCKENLYECDSYMFPLDVAINNNLLIKINDNNFVAKETTTDTCTWIVDEVIQLSDEQMKENDLYCRYRFKAHAINYPENYTGMKYINAGLTI